MRFMRSGLKRSVAAGIMAAACLCSARIVNAADAPRTIDIAVKKFSFTPAEITLKKGEPVVLSLQSEDVTHGVKFPELGLKITIGKGEPARLAFTPEKTGDFVGHCSRFCGSGHGSMTLTLHVTE
jgi:cytochrome c oxidase subunit 2